MYSKENKICTSKITNPIFLLIEIYDSQSESLSSPCYPINPFHQTFRAISDSQTFSTVNSACSQYQTISFDHNINY